MQYQKGEYELTRIEPQEHVQTCTNPGVSQRGRLVVCELDTPMCVPYRARATGQAARHGSRGLTGLEVRGHGRECKMAAHELA